MHVIFHEIRLAKPLVLHCLASFIVCLPALTMLIELRGDVIVLLRLGNLKKLI